MQRRGFHVIFGGSFDPPHQGHDLMLQVLLRDSWVEKLHWIPTGLNPLKDAHLFIEEREAWIELWKKSLIDRRVPGLSKLSLETHEIDAARNGQGPSYTYDTLKFLQQREDPRGESPWALALGEDLLGQLPQWKKVGELCAHLSALWIFPRPADLNPSFRTFPQKIPAELKGRCAFRWMSEIPPQISSTEIRALLADPNALQKVTTLNLLPEIKENLLELLRKR